VPLIVPRTADSKPLLSWWHPCMPRSYASLLRHSELGCLFRWRADALSIRRAFYLGARLIAGCLGLNHEAFLHDL
jgi:hypothetical protein